MLTTEATEARGENTKTNQAALISLNLHLLIKNSSEMIDDKTHCAPTASLWLTNEQDIKKPRTRTGLFGETGNRSG